MPELSDATVVFETPWFNVELCTYEGDDAPRSQPYYRVNGPDGAIVLALTPDHRVVLIRQFRPAIGEYTIELPAGAVDKDETPTEAAARELYEETGMVCAKLVPLGSGYLMASRFKSLQYGFIGHDAARDPAFEAKEDIEVLLMPQAELRELALSGELRHYTALAYLLLAAWRGELRQAP